MDIGLSIKFFELFGVSIFTAFFISMVCGFIGTFVTFKRMNFLADTLGHASLLGIALGVLLGVNSQLIVIPFAVILAVVLTFVSKTYEKDLSAITAFIFSMSVSLGILLLSKSNNGSQETLHILFGDLLWITWSDILLFALFNSPALVFLSLKKDELTLMMINSSLARARNVNVELLEYLFMICIALVIASAIKLVGIVMVMGVITLPALSASLVSSSFKMQYYLSPLLGLLCAASGLHFAFHFDWPVGPSIVVFNGFLFGALGLRRFFIKA